MVRDYLDQLMQFKTESNQPEEGEKLDGGLLNMRVFLNNG